MRGRSHLYLGLLWMLVFDAFRVYGSKGESSGKVLVLGAANGWTNWTAVESFSGGAWSIDVADLDGFGDTMRQQGFQAALDQFDERLNLAISLLKPSVLIVASKGLNILTHLATTGVYSGAAVLLSPIPNECDHIRGNTWEEQWADSMKVLVEKMVAPISIGVGTSADEQSLIVDMMNETKACGDLQTDAYSGKILFERCPNWFLGSFPGDHGWKSDAANAIHIASLISIVNAMEPELRISSAGTQNEL